MTEKVIWGIHAGRTGDANNLFLNKNYVALGWDEIGDLSKLGNNREAFKAAVINAYPDKKPGAIPNNAGQLYRFVNEMKIGDIIAYPSKGDRHIHFGVIEGNYIYKPSLEKSYPHLRQVKWLKNIARTKFTQGALYEIGSAMSFF